MDPVGSRRPYPSTSPSESITPKHRIGSLITPRFDDSQPAGQMRYELTPGAYFWSKDRVTTVFGLKLVNPPLALVDLLEEVNRATPKQVFFFDSRSLVGVNQPIPFNFVDTALNPDTIPVFLNPDRATPETAAHELMHAWLEFFLDFEDPRQFVDQRDYAKAMTVNVIQSMVLDCTVLWGLRKRGGLNLDQFRHDIVAAAAETITPFKYGLMHGSLAGQLLAAQALAVPTAFPDLYKLKPEEKHLIDELWQICRLHEPGIAKVAEQLTKSLRAHGYDTVDGARRAIDECLLAAFRFLGVKFDLDRDLIPREMSVSWVDKMPEFIRGAPPRVKHEVLRDVIRMRRQVYCTRIGPDNVIVDFVPEGSPFNSRGFPRISRPSEAGPLRTFNFFPLGLSNREMDDLPAKAIARGIFPHAGPPLPPPDIYAPLYEYSDALGMESTPGISEGGPKHVLHS